MKHHVWLAAVAVALVGGACATSSADVTTKHLVVTSVDEKATVFEQVDLGKSGFGVGDQFVEEAPVVDADGKTIGNTYTTVTIVSAKSDQDFKGIVDCTVFLPRGNVLFHGGFESKDLATGAVVPVIGGTEDYAGAGGTVTMKAPTPKETKLTFDLLIPTID